MSPLQVAHEENEWRTKEPRCPKLPAQYHELFRDIVIPGTLELRNLKDGRILKLHTGAEDSEVLLREEDGSVAYLLVDGLRYGASTPDTST